MSRNPRITVVRAARNWDNIKMDDTALAGVLKRYRAFVGKHAAGESDLI
jgi:hypothetical protein